MKTKVAVLGGGSWATALLKLLLQNELDVRWWVRSPETVGYIREFHHNPKYISSIELHLPDENVSADVSNTIKGADWILLATPSAYLKDALKSLNKTDFEGKYIISAIKGLVQPENLSVSEYMEEVYGIPADRIINISGPCHAEEVAAEKLSYLTLSSKDINIAKQVASFLNCRYLYTSVSTDIKGTEYASVLKNVYALVTGISIGLAYGDNFRAVLVPRAMLEMQKFIDHLCPGARNILEPAYLGDTLVTAYSQYSRNRTFGLMIGKGYTVNSAILELNMVAEGFYATKSLKTIADANNLSLPILNAAYNILYEHVAPALEFEILAKKLA
jgi:glycerol-3-phosphate dehydrogenase (NAD(P)+)